MPVSSSGNRQGLLKSLGTFASSLLVIIHTRLELLCTDLEAEREHLYSLIVLTLAALLTLGIGVVLASIVLVMVFWDTHRIAILGILAAGYLGTGLGLLFFALHKAKNRPGILSASMKELVRDWQQLDPRT